MKNFNFKTLLLAIGLVVASVQLMWAEDATGMFGGSMAINGASETEITNGDRNLGAVDKAEITDFHAKTWKSGNGDVTGVTLGYKFGSVEQSGYGLSFDYNIENNGDQQWKKGGDNINIARGLTPGSSRDVYCWFKASTNKGDRYYKGKDDKDLHISFTINAYLVGSGLDLTWNDDYLMTNNTWTKDNVTANTPVAIKVKKKGTWDDAINTSGICNVTTSSDKDGNLAFNTGDHKSKVTISVSDAKINVNVTPYYTVTFNDGTSNVETKEVLSGSTTTAPGNPSKTGYTFDGWYNGNNKFTNNSTTITSDITYTAKWTAKKTTITLNAKGGTGGTTQVTATYDAAMPTATMPTKIGYAFGGYYDGENGTGTQYYTNTGASACAWDKDISSTTLYAKWTAKTTTITLDAKGGTDGTAQVTATYDAAMPTITKPTKNGYNFDGYYDADGSTSGSWGTQYYSIVGASASTWDKDVATATLYAKWTEIKHTASIAYKCESTSIKESATSGQAGIATTTAITAPEITGYTFSSWATLPSGASTSDELTSATINVNLTADHLTITANYNRNATFDLVVNAGTHVTTVSGGVTGQTSVPFVQQISATAFDNGYEFNNWTASPAENAEFASSTSATTNVTVKNGSVEVTANAKPSTYSITYNNVAPSEHTNPATYTIETATITLQDASRTDYTFDGWFDAETEGNKVTEIVLGSFGDKVLWARWHETLHIVNIIESTGIESTTPSGATNVGNVTPVQISAVVKEGYSWSQWTKTGDVTIAEASNISTTIQATGAGTVTATATENTVTLTPTVNDDNMGSVSAAGTVGIATGLQLTATKKDGYKFDHWVLSSNLAIQDSKTVYDNPITVKTNGDGNAVSAQAIFIEDLSTGVYLKGEGNFGGWEAAGFEFMKPTGQSTGNDAYVTITTTAFEAFWQVSFALFDHGTTMVSSNYFFFNSTLEATLAQAPQSYENMKFFSTVAGDYVFHYNLSTQKLSIEYPHVNCVAVNHTDSWSIHPLVDNEVTINLDGSKSYKFCVIYDGAMYANLQNITDSQKELKLYNNYESFNNKIWINTVKGGNYVFNFDHANDARLTVTYPEETYQTVTVYEDGITPKEVKVYEVSKPSITAQVPEGMNFNGWVTTGSATVDNASATTTTVTNAGTNGTVKATFNTNQYIYFKDGVYDKYGNVWVTFRNSDYWDNSNGSGNNSLAYAAQGMTKIKNTDIHYFHIDDTHKDRDEVKNGIVQFTNSGNIQQNFYYTKVAYPHHNNSKSCYRACLPLFVPRDWITTNINSSQYYNDGIWMKYNSTESGFRIKGSWDSWTSDDYKFVAETPGGYEFKTTLQLTAGTTYDFKIYDDDNRTYSINGVMTATSCSNWHMYMDQDNCQITASETGNYTFILNLGSGEVIVSVEYPLSASDYQVVAKQGETVKWVGDLIKHSDVAKNDTTSFFNNHYTYQLQQYAGGDIWNNVGSEVTIVDAKAQEGVITLIVTQDGNDNATLAYEGIYTGNYYIRTDGVDGGWGDYENNSDNKMDNYGSSIQADPEYQYDVYKAKWITSGKNVKFRIANDYSKAISDELKGDAVIGNDKETLPQSANVRFMWNSKTNQLKRAYLSGSANPSDRYLILEGDDKMFNATGDTLTEGKGKIAGLDDYELNFADKNNWVYQADIQAQPGCAVKLTAKYNGIVQYFIGKEGDGDDSRRKIIDGSGTDKYNLRAVYDFKTNRLVVGWMPNGEITSSIELGSDMLIERTEHGDASQIVFGGSNPASLSISKIQHIYGVLKLTKATMIDNIKTDYEKSIYWISFPFDVKVSEIFGLDKYGEVWVISKYCGEKRAQKGWFKQDTESFWEFMGTDEIMKANVGYTLNLDPDYFNKETSKPWENSATEISWYFPSIQENVGVVSLAQKDTTLAAQHCDIDRDFNIGTEQNPIMVNHKFTDSNWRTIGVPAFKNLQAPTFNPVPTPEQDKKTFGLTGFYEWQPTSNTYTAQSASGYTFKASHGYMVQYEGNISWSEAAAITTEAPKALAAPAYETEEAKAKNYSIKLEFGNEAYTDQTFVTLTEKASTDFVLNEDMMKIDNAGFPNIYSFAGNYNVAYNETKMDNQTVTLGVSAPKAGTYTFSMPKEFSGTAKLIDLVEGTTTDLNVSNYSVDLSKGTYNDRFQLLLEVEAKAPTSMENVDGGKWNVDGKTTKLLRDGNIYLINGGRVYNATGAELR